MRIALTFFWVILGFLILYIFSQNVDQTVSVDLLFVKYEQVNLITVTFVSLLLGFILGAVFLMLQVIRSRKEKNLLKKQIRALQTELSGTREKGLPPEKKSQTETDDTEPADSREK